MLLISFLKGLCLLQQSVAHLAYMPADCVELELRGSRQPSIHLQMSIRTHHRFLIKMSCYVLLYHEEADKQPITSCSKPSQLVHDQFQSNISLGQREVCATVTATVTATDDPYWAGDDT